MSRSDHGMTDRHGFVTRTRVEFAPESADTSSVSMPAPATELELPDWAPVGRPLELPGRGTTWIHEMGDVSGPTVFLLHGWTATAALNWYQSFRSLVEAGYHVVAIDHRGHGRGLRSANGFTLEDCADDVAVAADQLGIRRFIAVGYSMGGPIAQLVWHRHRPLVDGLVLCSTAATFHGRRSETALFGLLGGLSLAARHVPDGWPHQIHDRIRDRRFDDSDAGRWASAETRNHDPHHLLEAGRAIGRFDSRPWIGGLDVPAAVVITTRDGVVAPDRQTDLADRLPHARRYHLDADHDVCAMNAAVFKPSFLDALDHVATGVPTTATP